MKERTSETIFLFFFWVWWYCDHVESFYNCLKVASDDRRTTDIQPRFVTMLHGHKEVPVQS